MSRWAWLLSSLFSCLVAAGEETCSATSPPRPPRDARPRWRSEPYGAGEDVLYGGETALMQIQEAGFDGPVRTDDWDVLFSHMPLKRIPVLPAPPWPRSRVVNHCSYFLAAGQKCALAHHTQRVERALGRGEGQHRHLRAYSLDDAEQFEAWRSALEADPSKTWVIKTCTGGGAEEVKLLRATDWEEIQASKGQPAVAQEYFDRPLRLWGGGKFHLRAYFLATRWAPAAAFLYDEGTVKRSTLPHDPKNPTQDHIFSSPSDHVGYLSFGALWREIGLARAAQVKANLRELLAEIFGVSEAMEQSFGPFRRKGDFDCFDLFGLDVVLDEEYRPQILEVNQGPNLWAERSSQPVVHPIKGLLWKQVVAYARQRSDAPLDISIHEAEAIENRTLLTFTRVL